MEKIHLSKEQLLFHEIVTESTDYKLISKSTNLGMAAVIKGLLEWCDTLEKWDIVSLTPAMIKKELERYIDATPESNVKEYIEKLKK